MVGAIIIGQRGEAIETSVSRSQPGLRPRSWALADVLGQPAIERLAQHLSRVGCDEVRLPGDEWEGGWSAVTDSITEYIQKGIETVLIVRCGAYIELELDEMLAFHAQYGEGITRVMTADGPLDLWMLDRTLLSTADSIQSALQAANPALFRSHAYVNPLRTPHDLRRLVLDAFSGRCGIQPEGSEIKPGVWVCEGAQIARTARLVAPGFIGRNTLISDECLITRGSNVECNSEIDFGTAVEDSSILPNSYVGIGLDLCQSVVDGSSLLNLRHNVTLQMSDPVVLRHNTVRRGDRQPLSDLQRRETVVFSAD